MNVGIIGTGNIGGALTKHLTSRGHQVLIANSQGPATLTKLATETGAKAVTVDEAASAKDLVIIAIPESSVPNLPITILSKSKAIIIDAGNYYPSRDGKISEIEGGLTESEWVSKIIGHDVVKTFNNILAASLVMKATPQGTKDRLAIAVAGNDPEERKVVMSLVNEIGFDAVETGGLAESWRQQPGAPAYCHDFGADEMKSALEQAERGQLAYYRETADEAARPYFK